MKVSKSKIISGLLLASTVLLLTTSVYAQTQPYNTFGELGKVGRSGLASGTLGDFVSRLVKYVLGVLGIILIVLLIIGGFMYMTSQGNEESIEKSKKLLTASIVGLIIVIVAYILSDYIISAVLSQ